jgi:hypothetical protein
MMGEQEGAAAIDQTLMQNYQYFGESVRWTMSCASPADTKSDRGRVGMGLGKGLGVLLLGVTASFLSKDVVGHDDRNCAIFNGNFWLTVTYFLSRGAQDSQVWLHSGMG